MNIAGLCSTEERLTILSKVIFKADSFSVSQVSQETGLSKGLVSVHLSRMVEARVLEKRDRKYIVRDSPGTRALKQLLNLSAFQGDFFSKYRFVRSAGIYGSQAKGTNTEDSDIDLYLFVEGADEKALAALTSDLRRAFGDVRPLYLTAEKVRRLKEDDTPFYYALVFGSITVYGDDLEALQL